MAEGHTEHAPGLLGRRLARGVQKMGLAGPRLAVQEQLTLAPSAQPIAQHVDDLEIAPGHIGVEARPLRQAQR